VGFEPTIPEFELAKTVHAFDRAATVIGASRIQLFSKRQLQLTSRSKLESVSHTLICLNSGTQEVTSRVTTNPMYEYIHIRTTSIIQHLELRSFHFPEKHLVTQVKNVVFDRRIQNCLSM
jgi:hypothetical protein